MTDQIQTWSVFFINRAGHPSHVARVRGKTAEAALRNALIRVPRSAEFRVERAHDRLQILSSRTLSFEIAGPDGQNAYPYAINEYYDGVAVEYAGFDECPSNIPPVSTVRAIADEANAIFSELGMRPRQLALSFQAPGSMGGGYGGRAITGRNKRVYVQLEPNEVPELLDDFDYYQGLIWHEAQHSRYVFEGRWPTVWPLQTGGHGFVLALDWIVHFSMDGWIDRNDKPCAAYSPPPDNPQASLKDARIYELVQGCMSFGIKVDESAIKETADELWKRDTDFAEVTHIMGRLGFEISAGTPLGQSMAEILATPAKTQL